MSAEREKVVVAMSGGVDSSVAACLLIEQGYDVMGLFMRHGASAPAEPGDLTAPPRAAGFSPREPKPPSRAASFSPREPTPPSRAASFSPREPTPPSRAASFSSRGLTDPTHAADSGTSPVADFRPRDSGADQRESEPRTTPSETARSHQGCCSASDAADARFVAGMLGIPFYALNFEDEFDELIDYFVDEYAQGRTPNPCVVCNDRLKFGRIVEYADAVGARYIATGHYARVERRGDRNALLKAVDKRKDQSYVLFGLSHEVLDRVIFPLGGLTKDRVREIAARHGLPNQDKPDSVEICFVPDRDYARLVRQRRPEVFVDGDVVDAGGRVIGQHNGLAQYTIGQRRGLGIAVGHPIYVTDLNVATNTVTVGENEDLQRNVLYADRVSFLVDVESLPTMGQRPEPQASACAIEQHPEPQASACADSRTQPTRRIPELPEPQASACAMPPRVPLAACPPVPDADETLPHQSSLAPNTHASSHAFRAQVKIRYLHTPAPAWVYSLPDDRVRVEFDEPQRAITPGQTVVFYDGDLVIGGGWIDGAGNVG